MEKICIIGLGYVGLPLAVALSQHFDVIGFDLNSTRLAQLQNGYDNTNEISPPKLINANIRYTDDIKVASDCTAYIVTVPTPIDDHKAPDLSPLKQASAAIAQVMTSGSLVIYESTVFPGATEEICVPILAAKSNLIYNEQFFVGYSPERINPGDQIHTVDKILKVTSASNLQAADRVDAIYNKITTAGTYRAPTIRVAEASKVIENTQRDINIAFINELCCIFDKLNIDTNEVLKAAGTKWNFLNFTPGLVGGHCIGVDPYYLTQKAISEGLYPELVLAGRRINEGMANFVAQKFIKHQVRHNRAINNQKILILGCTFKENCPDFRNSKVFNLADELSSFGLKVDLADPYSDTYDGKDSYDIQRIDQLCDSNYAAIILAVAHQEFVLGGVQKIRRLMVPDGTLFDLKYAFPANEVDLRL